MEGAGGVVVVVGAGVTSPVPVKLQFTFVIPYRTAKGDIHTEPSSRK